MHQLLIVCFVFMVFFALEELWLAGFDIYIALDFKQWTLTRYEDCLLNFY